MTSKASLTELIKTSFIELMKDTSTATVGHVVAFDTKTQLAQIQIGIERVGLDGETFDPSPLIEVPVHFPGGDFFVEYEIGAGTEGHIIFSQRCIDGWVNTGGIAANPILRFHDDSDAIFIPGTRSQPNKITGFTNDGIRLRNKAGSSFIWLKKDGTIQIDGDVTLNGNITQTGDITASGTITGTTDVVGGTVSLSTHIHIPGGFNVPGAGAVVGVSGIPAP